MTDTSNVESSKPTIDRRRVVKGAAWSVPVVAAAASAPNAAASPVVDPECVDCFQPGLISAAVQNATVSNQTATVIWASALTVSALSCASLFQPGWLITTNSATLEWDTGYISTATLGGTTVGVGAITSVAIPGIFTFTAPGFVPGGSLLGAYPGPRPTKLSVNVGFGLRFGIGAGIVDIDCNQTIEWDITTLTVTGLVAPIPFVNSGTGNLVYTLGLGSTGVI